MNLADAYAADTGLLCAAFAASQPYSGNTILSTISQRSAWEFRVRSLVRHALRQPLWTADLCLAVTNFIRRCCVNPYDHSFAMAVATKCPKLVAALLRAAHANSELMADVLSSIVDMRRASCGIVAKYDYEEFIPGANETGYCLRSSDDSANDDTAEVANAVIQYPDVAALVSACFAVLEDTKDVFDCAATQAALELLAELSQPLASERKATALLQACP